MAKIAEIKGFVFDLNAEVEEKVEQLQLFVAYALAEIYDIAIDANAKAEALIEEVRLQAIEKLNEMYGIILDVNATLEQIVMATLNHIEKITSGDYLVTDDSYYVAIDGEGYAALLAEALYLTNEQVATMTMAALDFDKLAKADLISIAYNDSFVETAILDRAFSLLGASEATIDDLDWAALIGEENVAYVDAVRAKLLETLESANLDEAYAQIQDTIFLNNEVIVNIIESALYEKIRYNVQYAETILTIKQINPDATVVVLGAYDMYDIEVPDFFFEETVNVNELLNLDTLPAELLGYAASMIPADFAFATELTDALEYLATLDYTVDDITVSGSISLEAINKISSAHPMLYAVLFENVFFVDVMGIETNLEVVINEFNLLQTADIQAILAAIVPYIYKLTLPSENSYGYIVDQILAALDFECEHKYDDHCFDVDCNRCGEIRVPTHTFTDNYVNNEDATHMADGTKTIVCDYCGTKGEETVTAEGTRLVDAHSYVGAWFSDANNHWKVCECGEIAYTAAHVDKDSNGLGDVCLHTVTESTPDAPGGDNGNGGSGNNGNGGNSGTPADEDEGMSTGAKVAIIVSSSVVGTVGIFSLGWFGIAKKSWAEFIGIFKRK